MRTFMCVAGAVALVAGSPATAKKKPEISGLQLQQIQARDFEVSKAVSFPAVITVLQDAGYRIASADRDTGLITGSASTKSKMSYNFFFGMGKSKRTPVVSAFIEDRGLGSRIRLNFVMSKSKSNLYGMSSSDEEPVTDAIVYTSAFEKIEKEIFIRQALNAPKPATPAVQPAAAPAAATDPATPAPPPAAPSKIESAAPADPSI